MFRLNLIIFIYTYIFIIHISFNTLHFAYFYFEIQKIILKKIKVPKKMGLTLSSVFSRLFGKKQMRILMGMY